MAIHGTTHPHAPTRRHLCPPTTGRAGEIAPPPSAFCAFALLLPQLYCIRLPCWAFVFYRCEFRRMISSRLSPSGPKLPKPTHIRRSPNRRPQHSGVGTVRKCPLWAGLIPGPILCRPQECRRSRQFPRLPYSIRRAAGVYADSSGAPGCSAATPETPVAQLSHSSEAIPN
jgi:hypothetical protein